MILAVNTQLLPTSLNALGVKGVGEAGVLPIPAAIVAAVEDALAPFNIRLSQFPIRPRDLAALLAGAGAGMYSFLP
jgi:aerobic carbon-monoxide dehydrogenase large subunit